MKKETILFLFVLLLSVFFVQGSAPALIYGKVLDIENNNVENIPVVATWQDGSGKENSVLTLTFSNNDSINLGDPSLTGGYRIIIESVNTTTLVRLQTFGDLKNILVSPGLVYKSPDLTYSQTGNINSSLQADLEYILSVFSLAGKTYLGYSASNEQTSVTLNSSRQLSTSGASSINSDSKEYAPTSGSTSGFEGYPQNKTVKKNIPTTQAYSDNTNKLGNTQELKQSKFGSDFLLGIATFLLILIGLFFLVKLIKKLRKSKDKQPNKKLKLSIGKIGTVKTKEFMDRQTAFVNAGTNVEEAMDMFVIESSSSIPVLGGNKIQGVIEKKDIIFKISPDKYNELDKIKVDEIMNRQFLSCAPENSLGDIYTKLSKSDFQAIIVEKEGELKGTVDYVDILDIFHNANFVIENPPAMGQAMDLSVNTIDSNLNLSHLRDNLIKKDADYAIVLEKKNPIGIVTLKDLINSIKKGVNFNTTKIRNIMSGNVIIMEPGTSIYEGIKVAVERRFNQIPLRYGPKLNGIVNLKNMTRAYYEFVNEINNYREFK